MDKGSLTKTEVTYDINGRMKYHPEYHANQGTAWTTTDQKYLIDNYTIIGPEGISFALGRTIHTIMARAYELRKRGLMTKPKKRVNHPRMRKITGNGHE